MKLNDLLVEAKDEFFTAREQIEKWLTARWKRIGGSWEIDDDLQGKIDEFDLQGELVEFGDKLKLHHLADMR